MSRAMATATATATAAITSSDVGTIISARNKRRPGSPSTPLSLGSSDISSESLDGSQFGISSEVGSRRSSESNVTTVDGSATNAVLVSIVASIGNLLQGWDNAAIAGAMIYIKKDFNLQNEPMMEGLILAISLIGATLVTAISGVIADAIGRRPMLFTASLLYLISGLISLSASNEYILLLARLINGFGAGLVVTHVSLYISETAPADRRGLLNTLPQFSGSFGMLLSYCMVFWMSLTPNPNWNIMLGVMSVPSFVYLLLCIFYLPESPGFLVSKGRTIEAKNVLQRLRGRKDVSSEMALLVQGLEVGQNSFDDGTVDDELTSNAEITKLHGHEEGMAWFACSLKRQSVVERALSPVPSHLDPLVPIVGSMHENIPEVPQFTKFEKMFSDVQQHPKIDWDLESQVEGEEHISNHTANDCEDGLHRPLLCHQLNNNPMQGGEPIGTTFSSGKWHVAWKLDGKESEDGQTQSEFQRFSSQDDIPYVGPVVQTTAFVSEPSLIHPTSPAMFHPSMTSAKVTSWTYLLEPGVKHAMIVGVIIQILQQFAGINGILYYTPQILEQAGAGIIFSRFDLSSSSASILISALTTSLMLPSIGVAMSLMDLFGRRFLLLSTIPILILSLVVLVFVNIVNLGAMLHAGISTFSVIAYVCVFVMGFGPIPNVLCSEIFPTGVRGICMSICLLTFWIVDIIVTYTFPIMLSAIGLAGVFGVYALFCIVALIFVATKVPETKGMPVEVITAKLSKDVA